jgi:hypothetical protein
LERRFGLGYQPRKVPTVVSQKTPPESDPYKTDRNAPAGTPNSLRAEGVRDGRPSTDDSVVEAMDEEFAPLQDADAIIHRDEKKAGEAFIQDRKKK